MMHTEFYQRTVTSFVLGAFAAALFLFFPPMIMSMVLIGCLGWILLDEWPKLARHMGMSGWFLAIFYLILPFEAIVNINRSNQKALILMCILVASCDIGCYIFGSLFGKHLLAPSISPKKSWEGLIGGVVTTVLVLFIALRLYGIHISLNYCLLIGIPTALLAIAGDLFESQLKRNAGIKDTGTILPGHGGLLDRFDSILFVATFYYYFIL